MTRDAGNGQCLGAAFVRAISADARNSSAVQHAYLQAMRDGDFPNVALAFQDFAFQYGLYSACFVRYMSIVAGSLSDPRHKKILLANLAEEQGDTHDIDLPADVLASIAGIPHTRLYRRFQNAVGLDIRSLEATPECPGLLWSQQFLQLCETDECVGVGAIGIGTELIVSGIYVQILAGLKAHSDLTMSQRVFFDLHCVCDDQHAAEILLITEDLARSAEARERIEHGVKSAIDLRSNFWDSMLIRARSFPASDAAPDTRNSACGHQESL